jgi:hypothetical protein
MVLLLTILLMHLFNLKKVFSLLEYIVVEFVPTRHGGELRTWESGNGRKEETVYDEADNIECGNAKNTNANARGSIFGKIGLESRETHERSEIEKTLVRRASHHRISVKYV